MASKRQRRTEEFRTRKKKKTFRLFFIVAAVLIGGGFLAFLFWALSDTLFPPDAQEAAAKRERKETVLFFSDANERFLVQEKRLIPKGKDTAAQAEEIGARGLRVLLLGSAALAGLNLPRLAQAAPFSGTAIDSPFFDSMEIKHKECFIPNTIRHWSLQPVARYAREAAEFVNLYSRWRGINRWPALVMVLDLLRERPEVQRRGAHIPAADTLRAFATQTRYPLSNDGLLAFLRDYPAGPELKTAYITLSGKGELVAMDWPRGGLPLNFLNK